MFKFYDSEIKEMTSFLHLDVLTLKKMSSLLFKIKINLFDKSLCLTI